MWDWLVERIYFVPGDFANPDTYKRLQAQMEVVNKTHGCDGNNFFYLAVAPRFFSTIVQQLGSAGMGKEQNGKWSPGPAEKPFGHDSKSPLPATKRPQKNTTKTTDVPV